MQLENACLAAENKKLKAKSTSGRAPAKSAVSSKVSAVASSKVSVVASSTVSATASSTVSATTLSTVSATSTNQDASLDGDYSGLGKRFAILSELWVRRSILGQPNPPHLQSLGPWHPGRCANNAAWDEGIVAELYFLLPGRYHELIECSPAFSAKVR